MKDTRRVAKRSLAGSVALLAAALAGCGEGGGADETIDREVFVQAYVDLRIAALDSDPQVITEAGRADVLSRHGVTEDDLTHFADVHAPDVEFMRDVWNDIEVRMDRRPGDPEPR